MGALNSGREVAMISSAAATAAESARAAESPAPVVAMVESVTGTAVVTDSAAVPATRPCGMRPGGGAEG
jgi:hypothetical protein